MLSNVGLLCTWSTSFLYFLSFHHTRVFVFASYCFCFGWRNFLSMVFSILLFSWLTAILSVVLSRIGRLLNSFLNCVIVSSVNLCTVLFSCSGLVFVWEVSNFMNLWSNTYGPVMNYPSYVAGVMIRSNVCPRMCVGMLMCCFKLNAAIVSRSVCLSRSFPSFMWMLTSPMIIRSWCFKSSSVSRSVNLSIKLLLLNCCSVPCGRWYILIIVNNSWS